MDQHADVHQLTDAIRSELLTARHLLGQGRELSAFDVRVRTHDAPGMEAERVVPRADFTFFASHDCVCTVFRIVDDRA